MAITHGTGQSNAIEDYAKSIYSLQQRAGGAAVSTNALAERCGVTPASASAMVKKLAERGLAIHEPYHGVRLTEPASAWRWRCCATTGCSSSTSPSTSTCRGIASTRRPTRSSTCSPRTSRRGSRRSSATRRTTRTATRSPTATSSSTRARPSRSTACRSAPAGASCASPTRTPRCCATCRTSGISVGDELEVLDRQPFEGPCTVRFATRTHVLGLPLCRAMRVSPRSAVAAAAWSRLAAVPKRPLTRSERVAYVPSPVSVQTPSAGPITATGTAAAQPRRPGDRDHGLQHDQAVAQPARAGPGQGLPAGAVLRSRGRFPKLTVTLRQLSFIHFARWTVISKLPYNGPPQKKGRFRYQHMYFESNFNGGWEEYIDAFSHILAKRDDGVLGQLLRVSQAAADGARSSATSRSTRPRPTTTTAPIPTRRAR